MAVTIKDIARIAGVSIATVSRVINKNKDGVSEETRQRVRKIIEEWNYHPNSLAKSMVTKQTNSLGLILPDVSNPFFADIAKFVETAAKKAGYNVFLCNSDEDIAKERGYISALQEKKIDGLLLIPVSDKKAKQSDAFFPMPVVLINRSLPGEHIGVYVDNAYGSYMITKELIKDGHKKFAFLGGAFNDHNAFDRFSGFYNACKDYGINVLEQNKFFGEYTLQCGLDYAEKIAKLDVTACVCGNDLIALGLISGLIKRNIRVPEDISVTGFDDILLSSINNPPITTVKQPVEQMSSLAVNLLVDIMNGKEVTSQTLKTSIVIRESNKKM